MSSVREVVFPILALTYPSFLTFLFCSSSVLRTMIMISSTNNILALFFPLFLLRTNADSMLCFFAEAALNEIARHLTERGTDRFSTRTDFEREKLGMRFCCAPHAGVYFRSRSHVLGATNSWRFSSTSDPRDIHLSFDPQLHQTSFRSSRKDPFARRYFPLFG